MHPTWLCNTPLFPPFPFPYQEAASASQSMLERGCMHPTWLCNTVWYLSVMGLRDPRVMEVMVGAIRGRMEQQLDETLARQVQRREAQRQQQSWVSPAMQEYRARSSVDLSAPGDAATDYNFLHTTSLCSGVARAK